MAVPTEEQTLQKVQIQYTTGTSAVQFEVKTSKIKITGHAELMHEIRHFIKSPTIPSTARIYADRVITDRRSPRNFMFHSFE